ncbi:MAG: hypothetical protein WBM37_06335 [Nitrososphaeraceae archaeon]
MYRDAEKLTMAIMGTIAPKVIARDTKSAQSLYPMRLYFFPFDAVLCQLIQDLSDVTYH